MLSGLGKLDRKRLGEVVRRTKGTVIVVEAAQILELPSVSTAKILARWAKAGWLARVRRGLYIPIPLEAASSDVPLEDAWILAARIFEPCYIGGWSAAEYWGMTEQIFRTVAVMTAQKPRKRIFTMGGTEFKLRTVPKSAMFGLKPVWKGQMKILVSDPARTILDMLNNPTVGGGIRPTTDILKNWLESKDRNVPLLMEYADTLGSGAVYKRLGYLLESCCPEEQAAIETCLRSLTKGYASLDPSLESEKIITRWRLWLPKHWEIA